MLEYEEGAKMEYDIALSFAGEDRSYVEEIANLLLKKKVRVFYDNFETSNLWGKNLYTFLRDLYRNKADFCVVFLSKSYTEKNWTRHEFEAATDRAFKENREYILPIILEDTDASPILDTTGYINASAYSKEEIVNFIVEKLNKLLLDKSGGLRDLFENTINIISKQAACHSYQLLLYLPSEINGISDLYVVSDLIDKSLTRWDKASNMGMIMQSFREKKVINKNVEKMIVNYVIGFKNTKTELVIPIMMGQVAIGVVNLESAMVDTFNDNVVKNITEICENFAEEMKSYDYFGMTFEKIERYRVLRYLQ